MTQFLKAVPLIAALLATPALAQTADEHAAHHPKAPATSPTAKPDAKTAEAAGCPGPNSEAMGGQMAGGQMMGGQAMADHMKDHAEHMKDHMAGGQMMGGSPGGQGKMGGPQGSHCRPDAGKTPVAPAK